MPKWFFSEVVGTFLLVFFGTGAVATAVAFDAPSGLFQIAAVWGFAVTIAIYLTAQHSGAHINPAITIAFAVCGDFPKRRVPGYIAAQFVGAFLAAAAVFILFGDAIGSYEIDSEITRGQAGSEASARMFGEFFSSDTPHGIAFFAEFLGTLLLAFAVFGFTAKGNKAGPGALVPIAIGITLATLICIFAPLTQAGFNPARDLAPRLFSSIAGWGNVPFSANGIGWLTVYVIAPPLGAVCGAFLANRLHQR